MTPILFGLFFGFCLIGCRWIVPVLVRHDLSDVSNERSSHTGSTPRGGGLGFVPILLIAIAIVLWVFESSHFWWAALAMTVGFGLISLVDDIRSLGSGTRLLVHLILSATFCWFLPVEFLNNISVPGLEVPVWFSRAALTIMLVWWINLYNFMDGIDGISIVQTGTICTGLLIVFGLAGFANHLTASWISALTLLACLAFATVNWHPAKVFLGDVGSITLGALTGVLLIYAGANGFLTVTIIVSLYYSLDATLTLLWRTVKLQKVWRAHRLHAYQIFVAAGHRHDTACFWLIGLNLALIGIAVAPIPGGLSLFLAIALTVMLILKFRLKF